MSTRLRPGDVVYIKRPYGDGEGVDCIIALENSDDVFPCPLSCGDEQCREWSNVMAENGKWHTHVSECQMEVTDFGLALRQEAGYEILQPGLQQAGETQGPSEAAGAGEIRRLPDQP